MTASSDPPKTVRREVIKRMRNIGMGISRRKYIASVVEDGNPAVSCLTDVSFSERFVEPIAAYGSCYR